MYNRNLRGWKDLSSQILMEDTYVLKVKAVNAVNQHFFTEKKETMPKFTLGEKKLTTKVNSHTFACQFYNEVFCACGDFKI